MQNIRFLIIVLILLIPVYLWSASYISIQDGNWSSASIWAVQRTGTISCSTASANVTGVGTLFTSQVSVGNILYNSSGQTIGEVSSITDDENLVLTAVSGVNLTTVDFYSTASVIPANGDNISILAGTEIDVAADLQGTGFGTLDIYGTLNIGNNLNYNNATADVVNVKFGGKLNIAQDLYFSQANAGMFFNVEAGGECYIGDELKDENNGAQTLNNNGYLEVNGDIKSYTLTINNLISGVFVAHASISGVSAMFPFNNYGIVTIDRDLSLRYTSFTNFSTGKLLVFGTIHHNNAPFINRGFVQCINSNFGGSGSTSSIDNTDGTMIIQDTLFIDVPYCQCYGGDLYLNVIDIANPGSSWTQCSSGLCSTYLENFGKKISLGRRLWLASDFIGYGLGADNTKIYRWFDLANSFGFKMSESNAAFQPTLKNNATDNINFNPVMDFSGGEVHLDLDDNYLFPPDTATGIAFMAVVIPESGNGFLYDFGTHSSAGYGFGYSPTGSYMYTPTDVTVGGGAVTISPAHTRGSNPTIVTMTVDYADLQSVYYDGDFITSTSISNLDSLALTNIEEAAIPGTGGPVTIGGLSSNPSNSSYDFEGKVAELMIYAFELEDSDREAAETYLALKYGISLPHAYLDYNKDTIWSIDALYNTDIFGLAREDLNILHQNISTSLNSPGELILSTGNIATINKKEVTTRIDTNSCYLICAHNGQTLASGNRVYKLKTTKFNQNITLQFNLPGLTAAPLMVVSDDDAFSVNERIVIADSYDGTNIQYTCRFNKDKTSYFKLYINSAGASLPGVGINTSNVDSTAQLQINSIDKGILIPALANSSDITGTPVEGLLFYNTTHDRFMYYTGTEWRFVGEPLKQIYADMENEEGNYLGEIRYDSTNKKMRIWTGSDWANLNNN